MSEHDRHSGFNNEKPSLRWSLDLRVCLLGAFFFPCLVALGLWQLDREQQKVELLERIDHWQAEAPLKLESTAQLGSDNPAMSYRRIALEGRYIEDRYLLFDNRSFRGRFGYEVLSLFQLANTQEFILINRGWVAGDPARLITPMVPKTPAGEQQLIARIAPNNDKAYELSGAPDPEWGKSIQRWKSEYSNYLSTDGHLAESVLRLDPGQAGSLVDNWQAVVVQPAKHRGYAVQWFAMAVTVLLIILLGNSNLWQVLRYR